MIEIIVNCNGDVVTIFQDKSRMIFHVKYPQEICNVLAEVLNVLGEGIPKGYEGVRLSKIDEDTNTTIGEW